MHLWQSGSYFGTHFRFCDLDDRRAFDGHLKRCRKIDPEGLIVSPAECAERFNKQIQAIIIMAIKTALATTIPNTNHKPNNNNDNVNAIAITLTTIISIDIASSSIPIMK